MVGLSYTVFDTLVGRCGLVWSHSGIVGVQLPEAREIETRRQLLRRFPEAREVKPPLDIEAAIDGIGALLRGQPGDFSDVTLDMQGVAPFNRKVYEFLRTVPRGETLTYGEIAARLGASGATHAVGQAIARNPFTLIVPCHRALEVPGKTSGMCANSGVVTKFRLLSLEGALASRGPTLFDVLLSVDRPRPRG